MTADRLGSDLGLEISSVGGLDMGNNSGGGMWRMVIGPALLAASGCAAPPPATLVSAPPAVSAPAARIWFYRDYEPSISLNNADVALNGQRAALVPFDGNAVYRDVAPGRYHITVQSDGTDVNQDKYLDLRPGQEAFVKILASSSWESGADTQAYKRDTFYVSLVPPQVARVELEKRPLSGG